MSEEDGSRTEAVESALFSDVSELIERARQQVSVTVNTELVVLYWPIGKRVREDVLGGERAAYGQDVIKHLAARLTQQYGRGYSWQNLFRMVKFAELLLLSDTAEREFYAAHAARERWSVRTLRERIASELYARTITGDDSADQIVAVSPESQTQDDARPGILFRDPYVLDFLGLPGKHTESQLETAILDEIQRFLLELGVGFAFVERQKRMTIDGRDFRLDLLLYHITERCYVAVELKTRPLDPGDYGQMLLYLRWLDAHQRHPGDVAPVGLILCTDKGAEQEVVRQRGRLISLPSEGSS